MIYCTESGYEVPVEIVAVKSSTWIICKFPDGKEERVHRKFITATKGTAEIEQAMDKVTDFNVTDK